MVQFKFYLNILRRGWWIVLLTLVTAVAIALIAASLSPKVFRTTARYVVSPNADLTDQTDLLRSLDTLDRRSVITTYAEVFASPRIRSEAVQSLNWPPEKIAGYEVSAVIVPDTNVITVSIEGSNAENVQNLAAAIGERATAFGQKLYFLYDITLLDPARVPTNPISPTPVRDAGVAAVLGLVAGAVLAILRGDESLLRERNETLAENDS